MTICKPNTNFENDAIVWIVTKETAQKLVFNTPKKSPLDFLGIFSASIATLPNQTEVVVLDTDEEAVSATPSALFFLKKEGIFLAKLKALPNTILTIILVAAFRVKSPIVEGAG